jgi:UDP-glucose 4-epimerase
MDGGNGEVFNCGYGHGYSVRDVVHAARKVTGINFLAEAAALRPGSRRFWLHPTSKIANVLNWKPRHDDLEYIIKTEWECERKQ